MLTQTADPQHAPAAKPGAAPAQATDAPCDGIIHFGNVDWWYHNRGHASTRMSIRLAQRVPVVWVNSIGMRMPMPGKTEIAWSRYTRKLKSLTKGLRPTGEPNFWAYSPLFVPRYSKRWLEFNGFLLAQQIKYLRWRLGMKRPSAFVSMPSMTPAVERLQWTRIVSDRCDDFSTLPEADGPLMAAFEDRLVRGSHACVYVHEGLMKREQGKCPTSVFIGHGVDFDRFVAARPADGPRCPMPDAIKNLPKPIVGFYGGMDDYRMDAELMIKIARHINPGTLLLIGPKQMDLSKVLAEKNVRHIDQLPPEQLSNYAAHFDVGVIPFLANDFNKHCNPTKLKEYLALAFPIVATRLPAFDPYADLIYQAPSHEEFLTCITQALQEQDPLLVQRRRKAVSGSSWDAVAARVADLLHTPPLKSPAPNA